MVGGATERGEVDEVALVVGAEDEDDQDIDSSLTALLRYTRMVVW